MKNLYYAGRMLFLSLTVLAVNLIAYSQTSTAIVGSGTSTNSYLPLYTLYGYNYTQSVYTVADLTAAGLTPGLISKIGYKATSTATTTNFNQWQIYITPTTENNIGASYFPVLANQQVFNGNIPANITSGQWMQLTLSTPYFWDGQSNIVITINETTPSWTSTVNWNVFTPAGGGNKSRYVYNDGSAYNIASISSNGTASNVVPQLQLEYIPLTPPPAIGINTTTPSCATGAELSIAGTPATNNVWYWQSSPTGTSTANNASTPWTIYGNGTYYARTYESAHNVWSLPTAFTVNSFTTAPTPMTPMANANPACMPGTAINSLAPIAGHVNYWQGTSPVGTSTLNNASSPYNVNATGTYYLRALNTTTNCWSNPAPISVVVDSIIPSAPEANPDFFNYCTNAAQKNVTVQGPYVGETCTVTGSASGYDNASTTINLTNFSCATGTITSATLVGTVGTYCTSWYGANVYVNGQLIAEDVCLTTPINLQPYLPLTHVQIVSHDNDSFTDNVNLTATLTLTYNVNDPAAGIHWYDATANGNQIGNIRNADLAGSSLLTPATTGTYTAYAESVLGGCMSNTRIPVTINLADVHVEITPVAASCNSATDGSFNVTSTFCGAAPLQYSVNGGAYSPLPSFDLAPGIHTVTVKDNSNLLSPTYTINVPAVPGPNSAVVDYFTSDEALISWTGSGNESEWIVEWGMQGFTPGTNAFVGADTVDVEEILIQQLAGSTEYDVYISSYCGVGSVYGEWILANFVTDCEAVSVFPFCTDFEDSAACWNMYDIANDQGTAAIYQNAWGVGSNSQIGVPLSISGTHTMINYHTSYYDTSEDWLIMPHLNLTGNEVLSFNYTNLDASDPTYFRVVMSTTGRNIADFTTTLLASMTSPTTFMMSDTSVILNHVGKVYIAFVREFNGAWYYPSGIALEDVCVDVCNFTASTDGSVDACRSGGNVDLNSIISSDYSHGTWTSNVNQTAISGSSLNVANFGGGTYTFEYTLSSACMTDVVVATVNVVETSSAGENGVIAACKNQPINLVGGLSGMIHSGGTWYDASGTAIPSPYFTTGTLLGQAVYKYVVSNGVCAPDTAEVLVNISNCNWLGLDQSVYDAITVSPNPSTGKFKINGVLANDFHFEVLDLHGRVVKQQIAITSATTTLDLSNVETGMYMLRVFSADGDKLIRLVKQ